MKKTITLLSILLLTRVASMAQAEEGRWRIIAGAGFPNIPALVLTNVDKSSGPYQLGFKKFISEKVNWGIVYSFSSAQTKPEIFLNSGGNSFVVNYEATFATLLGNLDYTWKNSKKYNLYSGIALGFVAVSATANITSGTGDAPKLTAANSGFAYHITAIGAHRTFGDSRIGGYAELGFGSNGFLSLGLSYSIH
ncbi:MAG: hypothetical protein NTU43_09025 [Bacteroidetes bacterium]|nr:hypothetical protein [Bacteroidota bacterium]